MRTFLIPAVLLCLTFSACREDEYPLPPQSGREGALQINLSDTLYVRQNPDWRGFNKPEAIVVGFETIVYVADTDNNRLVMLDVAGRVMGYSQRIKRPVAIAQDRRLQLLVCAEFDTVVSGRVTTFGAVYRLSLPAVGHAIGDAVPRRVFFEPGDSTRRYTSVATLYDNAYYVGRTGPKNDAVLIDRDNAILLFDKNDGLISPVTSNFSSDGTGLLSIHYVTGLATLSTGRSVEFVFSQIRAADVEPLIKVQWIRLVAQGQTTNYDSKFYPSTSGEVDILTINKFVEPRGLVVDPSGTLFVVDAGTHRVHRFNSRGIERYSFGGASDPYGRTFNQPYGIAYFDKTLFIADRGNDRICRYKLSTDMQ